jgi:hypothetical protein
MSVAAAPRSQTVGPRVSGRVAQGSVDRPTIGCGGESMTVECPVCGEAFEREEDLLRHQNEDHVAVDVPDEGQAVP